MQLFWVGGAAGAPNDSANANNWSESSGGSGGAGVPTSADDVVLDSGSNANALTLTEDLNCNTLSTVGGWSGTLDFGGHTIFSQGTQSLSGTGTVNCAAGTADILGDGDFVMDSTLTAWNNTPGFFLKLRGNGEWWNKRYVSGQGIKITELWIAYPGKTCTIRGSDQNYNNSYLALNNGMLHVMGGSLVLDLYNNASFRLYFDNTYSSQSIIEFVEGSTVTAGSHMDTGLTSESMISIYLTRSTSMTIDIPAMTLGNGIGLELYTYNNAAETVFTINQLGDVIVGGRLRFFAGGQIANRTGVRTDYYQNGHRLCAEKKLSKPTFYDTRVSVGSTSFPFYWSWGSGAEIRFSELYQYLDIAVLTIDAQDGNMYLVNDSVTKLGYTNAISWLENTATIHVIANHQIYLKSGLTIPKIVVSPGCTVSLFDSGTCKQLVAQGADITVEAAKTVTVSTYTPGDFGGTNLHSSVPGTQYTLTLPAESRVTGVGVRDCIATNPIVNVAGKNNGNNVGWTFVAGPEISPLSLLPSIGL
jgi:hypothetical protein